MPLYESVFIARQDIPAQEVESLTDRFAAIIAENGGTIARREYWGLRSLAFRIKKNRKGHYVMFHIDARPAAVQEMERNLRLSEDVLRYLSTRVAEFDEGPTVLMQSRHAREGVRRDGRDGRGGEAGEGARPRGRAAREKDEDKGLTETTGGEQ